MHPPVSPEEIASLRAVLDPLVDSLEERASHRATASVTLSAANLRQAAQILGIGGLDYGILLALSSLSPRAAMERMLAHVEDFEASTDPSR